MLGSMARRTRTAMWKQFPALSRAEVAYRYRRLRTRLWDLAFIAELPPSDELALDVGANIGVYTFALSQRFASVHAFEPNPSVRGRLQALGSPSIQIWPVGLSEHSQLMELAVPVTSTGEVSGLGSLEPDLHSRRSVVRHSTQVLRLDDLGFVRAGLIKIDVEGHESKVLAGGTRLLEAEGTVVVVESEHRHRADAPIEVRTQLSALGYSGFFLHKGVVQSADEFSVARHQAHPEQAGTAEYVHMFVYTNSDPSVVVRALTSVSALSS